MSPTDVIFEAIDNSMVALEAKIDDPQFARDTASLETAHLAIYTLRQELFAIIKRERI